GGSFQLSNTLGGPAVDIDVSGRGAFDWMGSFTAGPVDLGAGTGVGRIVLDLTTAGSGTQTLTPPSPFGDVPSGALPTTATVQSGGGGFVNVQEAETTAISNATITVTIGANAHVTSGATNNITGT